MDVKRFRLMNGLSVKQIVAALKSEYPKYSKITHSMVENPASYGVTLLPEAERILLDHLGAQNRRPGDRHRNRYRLSCRVTETRYEEVKQTVEAEGRFPTVQAWLDWWISVYLRKKKAAPGGSNTKDGDMGNNSVDKIPRKGGEVNGQRISHDG